MMCVTSSSGSSPKKRPRASNALVRVRVIIVQAISGGGASMCAVVDPLQQLGFCPLLYWRVCSGKDDTFMCMCMLCSSPWSLAWCHSSILPYSRKRVLHSTPSCIGFLTSPDGLSWSRPRVSIFAI